MKFKLKAYDIWEFGQRKDKDGNPHQEDSIYPAHGNFKPSDRLFILCDGMGGHDAGEVASSTVCETMSKTILSECPDQEGTFTDENLRNAINNAYEALNERDNGAEKKMGTTMTFLKLHNQGATIAHIGDSRVYHIRPGKDGEQTKILFQTEDHSLINDLVKMGEMTREEARVSGQKNVITRAMQPGQINRCRADIHHVSDIRPGDYFYMCSDGMLEQEEMDNGEALRNIFSQAIESDEQKIKILIGATDENRDNHTAIIVHILDVEKAPTDKVPVPPVTESKPKHFAVVEPSVEAPSSQNHKVSDTQKVKAKEEKKGKGNKAIWIILMLLVIAGLMWLVWIIMKDEAKQPEEVVTEEIVEQAPSQKPSHQPEFTPYVRDEALEESEVEEADATETVQNVSEKLEREEVQPENSEEQSENQEGVVEKEKKNESVNTISDKVKKNKPTETPANPVEEPNESPTEEPQTTT